MKMNWLPGEATQELINKIKIDSSQPVPPFLSNPSSKKNAKELSGKKIITKIRHIKTPK